MRDTPFTAEEVSRLPDWVSDDERAALAEGGPAALRLAGRLLRSDHLEPALGERLRRWLTGALPAAPARTGAEAARELLATASRTLGRARSSAPPEGWAWEVVVARDEAESLLWALGLAHAPGEPELLERASAVDAAGVRSSEALARDLWRAPGPEDRRWLLPVARSSEPAWWLDPLVIGRVRERALHWLTRPLAGASIQAVAVPLRAADAAPGPAPTPERVARMAKSAEEPACRLAGGHLEIHVRDVPDEPPAVLVCLRGVQAEALEARLQPPGGPAVEAEGAVWVPLAGMDGPRALRVRWWTADGRHEARVPLRPPHPDPGA